MSEREESVVRSQAILLMMRNYSKPHIINRVVKIYEVSQEWPVKQSKLETKVKEISLLELKRKVGPPIINFRKKR